MQTRYIQAFACAVVLAASGCELVADFDRSKIDAGRPDTGVITPPPPDEDDAGTDASTVDASDGEDAG